MSTQLANTPWKVCKVIWGHGFYRESGRRFADLIKRVGFPAPVEFIKTTDFCPDRWNPDDTLVYLPGGRSRHMDESIGSQADALTAFVKGGGSLYATCGGAYWITRVTVYQMSPSWILKKNREHPCLLPALAIGPLLPNHSDDPDCIEYFHGALTLDWHDGKNGSVLVSGGGSFILDENQIARALNDNQLHIDDWPPLGDRVKVLGRYRTVSEERKIAVIASKVGKGRVVQSMVHTGYGPDAIDVPNYSRFFPEHDWKAIRTRLEESQCFREQVICDSLLELANRD